MAVLKVARLGHPILRQKAKEVSVKTIKSKEFQQFIADMIETMHEYQGVGLAAPQVRQSIRVCVVEISEDNKRYPQQKIAGLQVFINPKITYLTQETSQCWEGCLSVPGLRGLVARPNKIKVNYLDKNGKEREILAEGFLATVLQHEFDHLDGKLYIDRLIDSTKLVFEEEFDKYINGADDQVVD